jgi:hypothetical protein
MTDDDDDLGQSDDDSDSCIEVSDSDSCTEDDTTSILEEDDDPCIVDRQLDGQDDSTSVSADISHTIDDLTPQQSGDTSEDSHVLAPRDDELPMMVVTHMSSSQTPLIATSHEEVSDMSDMIEEPCVRDAHHRHVDPPIQEQIQGVQTVDPTHTDQHEEIESQLLETPLVEQIVETDRLMEHSLPGLACIEEDALHDHDQEPHHLATQLRVSEAMIMAATRRSDNMHALMADYCWRASVAHESSDEGFTMDDFHTLRERVSVMRIDYQQLLTDRDYLLRIGEMCYPRFLGITRRSCLEAHRS